MTSHLKEGKTLNRGILFLNLGLDVDRIEAVIWYLSAHYLPEEGPEGENVNLIIILSFLEQLRRHVGRGTRKLHRPLAKVSLYRVVTH
jgi:hypothetical protein